MDLPQSPWSFAISMLLISYQLISLYLSFPFPFISHHNVIFFMPSDGLGEGTQDATKGDLLCPLCKKKKKKTIESI